MSTAELTESDVLDVAGMAKFLKVGKGTVYAGCNADGPGRWAHFRIGSGVRAKIRFTAADRDYNVRLLHGSQEPTKPQEDFADLVAAYRRQIAPSRPRATA